MSGANGEHPTSPENSIPSEPHPAHAMTEPSPASTPPDEEQRAPVVPKTFSDLIASVDRWGQSMTDKLLVLHEQLNRIEAREAARADSIGGRVLALETRTESVEHRVDAQEKRSSITENRLTAVERRLPDVQIAAE